MLRSVCEAQQFGSSGRTWPHGASRQLRSALRCCFIMEPRLDGGSHVVRGAVSLMLHHCSPGSRKESLAEQTVWCGRIVPVILAFSLPNPGLIFTPQWLLNDFRRGDTTTWSKVETERSPLKRASLIVWMIISKWMVSMATMCMWSTAELFGFASIPAKMFRLSKLNYANRASAATLPFNVRIFLSTSCFLC